MPDLMHLVRFKAPPEQVFAALTTSEGIRQWWISDADIDSRVGGVGEFRFHGGRSIHRVTVEEHQPPRRARWKVTSSFRPEWTNTTISFEIRASDGGSELLFAQRGYPAADDNYALCTTGWGIYLARLQKLLDAKEEVSIGKDHHG